MPINPGYTAITKDHSFLKKPGREFRCPKCKKILMEGTADEIYLRCKYCGKWVNIRKTN